MFLGWNLKTILSYSKSPSSNLSNWKLFSEIKMLDFWTKKASFWYFCVRISKNFSHIWSHHPQISGIGKFFKKMRMLKFGTKNSLFSYFWVRFLKNFWHIWNQNLQIFLIAKFSEKKKKSNNMGRKMPYINLFVLEL